MDKKIICFFITSFMISLCAAENHEKTNHSLILNSENFDQALKDHQCLLVLFRKYNINRISRQNQYIKKTVPFQPIITPLDVLKFFFMIYTPLEHGLNHKNHNNRF